MPFDIKARIKKILFTVYRTVFSALLKLVGEQRFHRLISDQLVNTIIQQKSGQQHTSQYSIMLYHDYAEVARRHHHWPNNVLEIGTGCSLTSLACFLLGGAERAVGVDIEEMDAKPKSYYREAARYAAVATGFGWWRHYVRLRKPNYLSYREFSAESLLEAVDKVEYLAPVSADNIPVDDCAFDYVYSNAALEHVGDPDAVVREMSRIMSPGSIVCHEIDLRDHNASFPLEFLKYSEDEWNKISTMYGDNGQGIERLLENKWQGFTYCNRLTAADWIKLFESHGFEMLDVEDMVLVDEDQIDKQQFALPWRDRNVSDLSRVVIRLVARLRQ